MIFPRYKLYDTNHLGYLKSVLSGTLNTAPRLDFEGSFANLTGLSGALPLSRARVGLYLGLKYSLGEKKKVLLFPFTIFDAINMVVCAGGEPVFCDCESRHSPHIDLATLEASYTEGVGAVIITHYHTTNPHIKQIVDWCKQKNIILIEDCAISLGGSFEGEAVGSFGDMSFFSFGLMKFISVYYGGALWVRDERRREKIASEVHDWGDMDEKDMRPYFLKGLRFSLLLGRFVFESFTFWLFKYAYLWDIKWLVDLSNNVLKSDLKTKLPSHYQRNPNAFQVNEFVRQLPLTQESQKQRLHNASQSYNNLAKSPHLHPLAKPSEGDTFLVFPIVLKQNNRQEIVRKILQNNFDVAINYYKNCSLLPCFAKYHKPLPNLEYYTQHLIILPVHPAVPSE